MSGQCSETALTNSTMRAAVDVGLLQQSRELVVQVVGEVVVFADVDALPIRPFDVNLWKSIRRLFRKTSEV